MSSKTTEFVKEQIYPNLDAVASGLLDHLHPKRSGKAYQLDCPECGHQGRAFYYPGHAYIVCNRKNNCGVSTSIWDAVQMSGLSMSQALHAMADAAGVQLPEKSAYASDADKLKSVLKYGISKSKTAQNYLKKDRGWSEAEIEAAPFGYIHDMEYFMSGLERKG
ncbi:MAG TPA: hypothetical protein EYP10_05390, partial [Armatimonadetes bacterium]|nr:hypothetical protein [Armatimonadota bacterium]